MNRSSTGKALPYAIVQEIRNLLAIHCRELVMSGKSDGEGTEGQYHLCEKVFHGSDGYSSVLDTFLDGTGLYANVFNRTPIENNREGNEQRSLDKDGMAFMLELLKHKR